MTAAHVHLLLNHIPILGTLFGLLLLLYGFLKNSDDIKKASFGTFIITALITIPVYLTGDGAAEIVSGLPGVSKSMIGRHDSASSFTLIAIGILGTVSLLGLWLSRRSQVFARWLVLTVLALAVIATGLGMWTGNLGGQIHHEEVRSGSQK